MNDLRQSQDRNAWAASRLAEQLRDRTFGAPRKRRFGGPLALAASQAAPATGLASQRILLQSQMVSAQLALVPATAGVGALGAPARAVPIPVVIS